ncbi:MAG: response regulator [Desulfobacterales bacterium]|nr:response regulator [Desulfobacterales bacterium]
MSENPNILIVDDEEQFRKNLIKLLKTKGISAKEISRGEDAIEELSKNSYDVILLDLKMPGINGIEVLKEIKKRKILSEVIILSGHASIDTAFEIMKYGAYDYIMKPFDIEELMVKISLAYEKKIEKEKHK